MPTIWREAKMNRRSIAQLLTYALGFTAFFGLACMFLIVGSA